jgi:hypothetical protein
MKRLLLGTALTAACLIVLAGVGYADPPVFQNVPENPFVSAGTNDTAVITFTPPMSVTSDDPPTHLSCIANNGSTLSQTEQLTGGTFTLGTTLVICTGTDGFGDESSTIFFVTVVDQQLSFANVPSTITEDATSPAGATVAYAAPTAFEGSEVENIPVTCVPASGSVFAINPPRNFTTVTCTATDTEGSTSTATFLVHVRGAAEQITNLIVVVDSIPGGKQSFEDQLDNALTDVNAGNISSACVDLSDFINHVRAQSGKQLTVGQANQLISAAAQIRAVLGCG